MKYFLGIDGGGTKTTAAVSDENGNIVLKSVGKTINFYSVGMKKARSNLSDIMEDINNSLGNIKFEAAFVGCSALDDEADSNMLDALCGGVIDADKLRMNSDVYVALKSVDNAVCPCVAICGTGSMAIGENENGKTVVKGGWGHILGDDGSAYSIALDALKYCCNFSDRNKEEKLLDAACEYFGVSDFRKAIDIIYSEETKKDYIAGFAEVVGRLADENNITAKAIIVKQARDFTQTIFYLFNEIKSCSVLALYGGLFQHNKLFRDVFIREMSMDYPDLKIELLTVPPEEGALKIAREM